MCTWSASLAKSAKRASVPFQPNGFTTRSWSTPRMPDASTSPLAVARSTPKSTPLAVNRISGGRRAGGVGRTKPSRSAFRVLRATAKARSTRSGIRGVDQDLVVSRSAKGTLARFADFASEALQVHIGIQSDALLASGSRAQLGTGSIPPIPTTTECGASSAGPVRGDGRAPGAARASHREPLIETRRRHAAAQGLFDPTATSFADDFPARAPGIPRARCASCHQPMNGPREPHADGRRTSSDRPVAEHAAAGLRYDPDVGGYPVWLFSDLRRTTWERRTPPSTCNAAVALTQYLTPRLWSVADSRPTCTTAGHPASTTRSPPRREGAAARAAFAALAPAESGSLRVYLMSLRRTPRVMVPESPGRYSGRST